MKYVAESKWGNRTTPSKFQCATKQCRLQIETRAVFMLNNYLSKFALDTLPKLHCTAHPNGIVHIFKQVNEDKDSGTVFETLGLRCTAKNSASSWCNVKYTDISEEADSPLSPANLRLFGCIYQLTPLDQEDDCDDADVIST